MTLEAIIGGLKDFRRALRAGDRVVFDELMRKARLHAAAGSYQASLNPAETMFLAILIELAKENMRLREELRSRGGRGMGDPKAAEGAGGVLIGAGDVGGAAEDTGT